MPRRTPGRPVIEDRIRGKEDPSQYHDEEQCPESYLKEKDRVWNIGVGLRTSSRVATSDCGADIHYQTDEILLRFGICGLGCGS